MQSKTLRPFALLREILMFCFVFGMLPVAFSQPESQTKGPSEYLELGRSQAQKNDYDNAIISFSAAIRTQPTRLALQERGLAFLAIEQYDSAVADFTQAIRLEPNNPFLVYLRALAWQRSGNYEKALVDFNESIRLSPRYADAIRLRGTVQIKLGDFKKGLADLQEAQRLMPNSTTTRNSIAWLLATCHASEIRNGRQAVETATAACDLSSWKDHMLVDTLAAAQAEAGEFSKAVEYEKRAIELLPKDNLEMAKEYRERLSRYEQKKPYRDPATHPIARELGTVQNPPELGKRFSGLLPATLDEPLPE